MFFILVAVVFLVIYAYIIHQDQQKEIISHLALIIEHLAYSRDALAHEVGQTKVALHELNLKTDDLIKAVGELNQRTNPENQADTP